MSRILIVDDHDSIRYAIRVILESAGHSTIMAANGQEALAVLEEMPVDLLITDIQMPIMDGLTLIAEAHRRFPATYILVVSADPEGGLTALDVGAHLFLAKPFAYNQLIKAVEAVFQFSSG